ncbi:MAG: PAS domain-containing sensor histidine kinase [Candidatus Nealsonbacteria bacterium]|nr:PAS domain-containing sensor histidine kinase [Candidatus Nealsonbacteria bacterium]
MRNKKDKLIDERKFREVLLATIPYGIDIVDKNGKVLFMNKKLLSIFGVKAVGKKCWEIYKDNKTQCVNCPLKKGVKPGKTDVLKSEGCMGGKIISISHTGMMHDGDLAILEVFSDITKEKEIEEAKNEFLSMASHQLRTPLTGIKWTLEHLSEKEKFTETGRKYLDNVFSCVERLNELVTLLLSISRIESGNFKASPELIELVGFIEKSLTEFQPICEKKQVICSFAKHPGKLELKIDKTAFGHILRNLAGNAVDYTKSGGKVEISLEEKNGFVILKIQDDGIGIPKKDQSGIFGKFVRASNAHTLKPDGNGLGLYIVKEAVKLLNGEIWFESEEGRGTIFYVSLPSYPQLQK